MGSLLAGRVEGADRWVEGVLGGGRLVEGRSLTMGMKGGGECKVSFPSSVPPRDGRSPLAHATRRMT